MNYAMIGITVLIFLVMIFAVIMLLRASKKEKNKSNQNSSNVQKSSAPKSVADNSKKEDVFKFMEFDRIQDNMIVQSGGNRYTMAIRCKGINYDLMSEVEQMAVEQGFITFLNTLKYPIQLYVQAQNIDLKHVVKGYKDYISPLQEEYARYNKLYEEKSSIFDINKEEIDKIDQERTRIVNVYEYANDIISYVEKMSINKNLLQRNFYVLVSYVKSDIAAVNKFTKEEVDEMCYSELLTRCNSIISALASSSVTGTILNSNELADLLYIAYNRDDKTLMGVRDALESGFYRLYSTSYDAFTRKDEMLRESIETEAKLKAITSLKRAINGETHKTKTMEILESEEKVSRQATDMIKSENIDPDIKQDAVDDILEDYREVKKELQPIIEKEKNEIKEKTEKEFERLTEEYEQSDLYRINKNKEEKINLYNEELKEEKDELITAIEENGGTVDKKLYDNGEDDIIS